MLNSIDICDFYQALDKLKTEHTKNINHHIKLKQTKVLLTELCNGIDTC